MPDPVKEHRFGLMRPIKLAQIAGANDLLEKLWSKAFIYIDHGQYDFRKPEDPILWELEEATGEFLEEFPRPSDVFWRTPTGRDRKSLP